MARALALILLVATSCRSDRPPSTPGATDDGSPGGADDGGEPAPGVLGAITPGGAPEVIRRASVRGAPHSGTINKLVLARTGDAALTTDNLGGVRLWPALDGTREPQPVPVRGAQSLSLARADDGWTLGLIDSAGAGHILAAGDDGSLTELAVVAPHPRLRQIEVLPGGERVVLLRHDHSIRLLGRDGAELAFLEHRRFRPQHLRVTDGGLVAMIVADAPKEKEKKKATTQATAAGTTAQTTLEVGLQHIEVVPGDADTEAALRRTGAPQSFAAATILGHPHASISPDGARFAFLEFSNAAKQEWTVVVVDLDTGVHDKIGDPIPVTTNAIVGFASNEHLVVASPVPQGRSWLVSLADKSFQPRTGPPTHFGAQPMPQDFAGGVRAVGVGRWLFVQDVVGGRHHYLGHEPFEPIASSFSPAGTSMAWVSSRGHMFVESPGDAKRPVAHFTSSMMAPIYRAFFADEDHVITVTSTGAIRLLERDSGRVVDIADGAGPFSSLDVDVERQFVRYTRGNGETLIWDIVLDKGPDKGFAGPYILSDGSNQSGILAGSEDGPAVWTLDTQMQFRTYTLAEIRAGLSLREMKKRGKRLSVATNGAQLHGVDRDGNRYHLRFVHPQNAVVEIWKDGNKAREIQLDSNQVSRLVPSPDGARIAVMFHTGSLVVYDADSGDREWSYAFGSAMHNVDWSPDGTRIAAVGQLGATVRDAATGEAMYVTCGPMFGRHKTAPPNVFPAVQMPNICER